MEKEEGTPLCDVVETFALEWHDFKRALRGIDKTSFDELMRHAKNHIRPWQNMHPYNLFEVIVLSILLEHEYEINQLSNRSHS
jgi:hypothetical protein